KELVENALDAGARSLTVNLEEGGLTSLTVEDDGTGIPFRDLPLAFERHATSKIATAVDLDRIETLGFRGEALPSIAAVSRLTLETAPKGGGEATRIRVDGGEIAVVEPIARGEGTTVDVRGLFFNTPARRKFLKTHSTEQANNVRRMLELALARLEVGWRVTHGRRSILDLPPARTLIERLTSLHGPAYVNTLLPMGDSASDVTVRGLVQRAAAAGAGRRRQFVFVNGRPVDANELVRAALSGYRSTLPAGARPDLYLFIEVESDQVDVNVHPSKREVRLRSGARVANAVEEAVRSALGAGHVAARPLKPRVDRVAEAGPPDLGQLGLFLPGRRAKPRRAPGTDRSADESQATDATIAGRITGPGEELAEVIDREVLPSIWQLHNRYILAQTSTGVVFIDQHSAHERILYEEVVDDIRERPRPGQRLLFPTVLHLTPEQFATWESYRGLIGRLGFEIEPFGGDSIAIAAVPAFRHVFDPETALADLLDDLSDPGAGSADMNQHERVARLFACKAAIKAGQPLTQTEMGEVIDRLFATELPYDDVHGRPAVVQIALEDLNRQFGRH
ncbi:MAG: ATP-binding protein, partial [Gemmatimonadetes bacterium]|nr:ATP-binding protein [Gemmatimonadota bacterium]